MKPINNGFMSYYYLYDDGSVYNAKTGHFLTINHGGYKLQTVSGKIKFITVKKLMRQIYDVLFVEDTVERLAGEEFKFIPGTNQEYAVSNEGRVISYRSQRAKILKPSINRPNGYQRVSITINGETKNVLIHSLVAEAFCEKPEGQDLQIHHKNFQKRDNRAINLEYLTAEEHAKKHAEHEKDLIGE